MEGAYKTLLSHAAKSQPHLQASVADLRYPYDHNNNDRRAEEALSTGMELHQKWSGLWF
jgi:hypothetical protein